MVRVRVSGTRSGDGWGLVTVVRGALGVTQSDPVGGRWSVCRSSEGSSSPLTVEVGVERVFVNEPTYRIIPP